jgi:hypothetical protein
VYPPVSVSLSLIGVRGLRMAMSAMSSDYGNEIRATSAEKTRSSTRFRRDEAMRRLESELPLIDEAQPARIASIRNLLRADACKLRYGNFDSAAEKLSELLRPS